MEISSKDTRTALAAKSTFTLFTIVHTRPETLISVRRDRCDMLGVWGVCLCIGIFHIFVVIYDDTASLPCHWQIIRHGMPAPPRTLTMYFNVTCKAPSRRFRCIFIRVAVLVTHVEADRLLIHTAWQEPVMRHAGGYKHEMWTAVIKITNTTGACRFQDLKSHTVIFPAGAGLQAQEVRLNCMALKRWTPIRSGMT